MVVLGFEISNFPQQHRLRQMDQKCKERVLASVGHEEEVFWAEEDASKTIFRLPKPIWLLLIIIATVFVKSVVIGRERSFEKIRLTKQNHIG